ncbi:HlyD family secretion protein [Agrobacterium sp. NPDC089420]|uniref:HlyD family secretion protein n=1 Tax=Agrobacterium sp. NPDC089420 TaxID=3363918 RepID=UPI00384D861E
MSLNASKVEPMRAMDQRATEEEEVESPAIVSPHVAPQHQRKKIRRVLSVALLAVLVGGATWGWHYWTDGRFTQSTDDAFLQADQTAVAPKVQGYVEQVFVTSNQKVAAGDQLVKIRSEDYEAKVAQAEAALESSKADLVRARADAKRQVSAVGQAEAQLLATKTQASFTESQVTRYQSLAKTGAASNEQITNLVSQRDQANAQVVISEAALASAKEAINTADATIKQSEAAVKQATAQLATTKLDLDATLITAPVAGTVGDKTVAIGQYVQPGTRLMTLVPVEDLYLEANFKETQIQYMRVGQPVSIHVDALNSVALTGRVESFAPGTGAQFALIPAENATGNFTKIVQRVPVRIKVTADSDARRLLIPGLSVTVDVDTRTAQQGYDEIVHTAPASETQK